MCLIQRSLKQYYCTVILLTTIIKKDSRVLYTFIPNKSFGQILDISPKSFIFLKLFNSEFSYIEVWFTDQNSEPLEMEDTIDINLVIN